MWIDVAFVVCIINACCSANAVPCYDQVAPPLAEKADLVPAPTHPVSKASSNSMPLIVKGCVCARVCVFVCGWGGRERERKLRFVV